MSDTMKAAVLHRAGDLRYEEVPIPRPQPEEVLIRIRKNGLCGSDIHFYERGELGPFKVDQPYIPGHEASGVVEEPSVAGDGPPRGARVAIEPGIPCRRCRWCKSGRYNLCPDVVFLSAPPINGTFAEYAVVTADFAHVVPDNVSDEEAAFIEPISVGIQAANRGGLRPGMSVAIVGSGPIGLVTFLVSKAYGAADVYLLDRLPNRLALGLEMGADSAIDVGTQDPVEAIMDLTAGHGVDIVFDTSGSASGSALTPLLAARGGVISLVGWPEIRNVPFPMEEVMEKELDVRGVNRYCNTFPQAIALLSSGSLAVKPLITHRFPFAEVCEAFRYAVENRADVVKVMIG